MSAIKIERRVVPQPAAASKASGAVTATATVTATARPGGASRPRAATTQSDHRAPLLATPSPYAPRMQLPAAVARGPFVHGNGRSTIAPSNADGYGDPLAKTAHMMSSTTRRDRQQQRQDEQQQQMQQQEWHSSTRSQHAPAARANNEPRLRYQDQGPYRPHKAAPPPGYTDTMRGQEHASSWQQQQQSAQSGMARSGHTGTAHRQQEVAPWRRQEDEPQQGYTHRQEHASGWYQQDTAAHASHAERPFAADRALQGGSGHAPQLVYSATSGQGGADRQEPQPGSWHEAPASARINQHLGQGQSNWPVWDQPAAAAHAPAWRSEVSNPHPSQWREAPASHYATVQHQSGHQPGHQEHAHVSHTNWDGRVGREEPRTGSWPEPSPWNQRPAQAPALQGATERQAAVNAPGGQTAPAPDTTSLYAAAAKVAAAMASALGQTDSNGVPPKTSYAAAADRYAAYDTPAAAHTPQVATDTVVAESEGKGCYSRQYATRESWPQDQAYAGQRHAYGDRYSTHNDLERRGDSHNAYSDVDRSTRGAATAEPLYRPQSQAPHYEQTTQEHGYAAYNATTYPPHSAVSAGQDVATSAYSAHDYHATHDYRPTHAPYAHTPDGIATHGGYASSAAWDAGPGDHHTEMHWGHESHGGGAAASAAAWDDSRSNPTAASTAVTPASTYQWARADPAFR